MVVGATVRWAWRLYARHRRAAKAADNERDGGDSTTSVVTAATEVGEAQVPRQRVVSGEEQAAPESLGGGPPFRVGGRIGRFLWEDEEEEEE
jgi:hypothetical protein